jgi:hypothetical protein
MLAVEMALLEWDVADLRGAMMGYRGVREVVLIPKYSYSQMKRCTIDVLSRQWETA